MDSNKIHFVVYYIDEMLLKRLWDVIILKLSMC